MKKSPILLILLAGVLSSCNFISITNNEAKNNGNQSSENNNSQSEDENSHGENEDHGGGGNVTPIGGDYTTTWPSDYQKYIVSYFNGMLPCFLNANKKCLFNGFETGCVEGSSIPYFNPYIKNTSPGINYEYDYGSILRDAGFTFIEDDVDEDGVTQHYYEKGKLQVQYSKYKGDDNIYYFDVYAYYDYLSTEMLPNEYNFQYDSKDLGLTSKYEQNNKTINIKNWKITLCDISKQSTHMQLKSNTGKIIIEGDTKGAYIEFTRNANQCFVKAGSSKSTATYIFNEGSLYKFPNGTKYVEIAADERVVEFEFFSLGY